MKIREISNKLFYNKSNVKAIITLIIRYSLNFNSAGMRLYHKYRIARRMRNTSLQPERVQVAGCMYVCVYTDSSFARERRAKPSQSPYLLEMIRFESAVSHDNRTHSSGRLRAP